MKETSSQIYRNFQCLLMTVFLKSGVVGIGLSLGLGILARC